MRGARKVTLEVDLPADVAEQAEDLQLVDPEFLSRVVLYGLTRRSIYRHLRETERGVLEEASAHEAKILREHGVL